MSPALLTVATAIALLCCGVFTGAAIYVNLVEHPARMEAGTALALAEWAPAYRRGTLMQAPLAIVGGLAAVSAWLLGANVGWLVGGLLLIGVVPFTLLVIMPTNHALSAPDTAHDLSRATALLTRWNRLHAVRTVLSTMAFLFFICLLQAQAR
jgi:uncharacterized membrane protein